MLKFIKDFFDHGYDGKMIVGQRGGALNAAHEADLRAVTGRKGYGRGMGGKPPSTR